MVKKNLTTTNFFVDFDRTRIVVREQFLSLMCQYVVCSKKAKTNEYNYIFLSPLQLYIGFKDVKKIIIFELYLQK